ncbi:MAG: glycosyltransferase, partial [Candidatus Limiplasma sp.]|nr:glycosyltransferase [Candidatus Limiplasma sp.]
HFAAGQVALVSGVGVDLERFREPVDRTAVRAGLGIRPEESVLITIGEHSERKNHETVIAAAAPLKGTHVLFCGVGDRQPALEKQARELDMEDRVHFLGFRKDIPALLEASDVFVFPSLQEGLPVAQMEAMAAGLPCVVSDVRGNNDLIAPGEGGFLRPPRDVRGFSEDIERLLEDPALRVCMGERNRREMRKYSLEAVLAQMTALYRGLLGEREP